MNSFMFFSSLQFSGRLWTKWWFRREAIFYVKTTDENSWTKEYGSAWSISRLKKLKKNWGQIIEVYIKKTVKYKFYMFNVKDSSGFITQ